jgi:thiol:disulfide interchange protein
VTASPSFFGLGLLLAFTPCVFPMIPILSGIIAGQGDSITTRQAFFLSLAYVLAMALTYAVVGVIAGLFGANLQATFQNVWVLGAFALVFVALSLSMFGFYDLQLPSSWQSKLAEMSNKQEGGTLIGAAIMGSLSALIVGPCVAPPLMGALIFIGKTGDAVLGFFALFGLGVGHGRAAARHRHLRRQARGAAARRRLDGRGLRRVFGVLLLAVADWCTYCKQMERQTFSDPTVIGLMSQMTLLKADVTRQDDADKALQSYIGIPAPPAMIFWDANGTELRNLRLLGFKGPDAFATHLREAL